MPHPTTRPPRLAVGDAVWSLPWLLGYLALTAQSNRSASVVDAGPEVFWPSAGVGLAWLLLSRGPRFPWAVGLFVAATLGLQLVGAGAVPLATLLIALSHVVLVVGAQQLLTRRPADRPDEPRTLDLTTTGDLIRFGRAGVLMAVVTAAPASITVALDTGTWDPWIWLVWVSRTSVAMLAVGGTLLLVAQLWRRSREGVPVLDQLVPSPRSGVVRELVLLALATAGLGYVVFGMAAGLPISFVLVAVAVWSGLRFTPVVVGVYAVVIGVGGAVATGAGLGTFAGIEDQLAQSVVVQVFVALTSITGLLLSTSTLGQHHLTRRLAETTARFDGVLRRLDDFIWSVELRPDGSLDVLFASARETAVFGGPLPQRGDQDVFAALVDRVPNEDRALLQAFRDDLVEHGSAETELRIRGRDGVLRWAWSRASARHVGGRMVLEGITTDVTERKTLDDLRTQFLAIAGHELRTPLTVIRGYAETLGDRVGGDDLAASQAAAIARRAEQLEALVGDFFDLATYEHGRVSLALVPVELDRLVVDAVEDHAAAAAERQVSVHREAQPVTITGDLTRLRQVVDNLVDNAVKYSRPGGRVTVTCESRAGRAVLTVADDGIGVPPEELPHVFERFFRASSGRQQTVFGTGLGLAVVKAIVGAHGGRVGARAAEGGGFVVEVDLPLAATPPVVPAPRTPSDDALVDEARGDDDRADAGAP